MEQALCLLRPSLGQGELGKKITSLPKPLDQLVGKSSTPAKAALRPYLKEQEIPEDAVGGNIDGPIIEAVVGGAGEKKIAAAYFVIHDTASPKYPEGGIPADINQEAWRYNDVWTEGIYDPKGFPRQVNVIVNRLGYSRTYNDFSNRRPGVATQLEGTEGKFFLPALTSLAKNVFLHVESVVPRQTGKGCNYECYGPNPTFTDGQYERLALVYIAASVRAGRWLIPAYHVNIHSDHDDPIGFDLAKWSGMIAKHLAGIGKT